jgi:hypothetical protein
MIYRFCILCSQLPPFRSSFSYSNSATPIIATGSGRFDYLSARLTPTIVIWFIQKQIHRLCGTTVELSRRRQSLTFEDRLRYRLHCIARQFIFVTEFKCVAKTIKAIQQSIIVGVSILLLHLETSIQS